MNPALKELDFLIHSIQALDDWLKYDPKMHHADKLRGNIKAKYEKARQIVLSEPAFTQLLLNSFNKLRLS